MAYKLTVDHPNAGEGAQLSVHGLGTFENGKSYLIDDDLAEQFRQMNGQVVSAYDEQGQPAASEYVLGPALDEIEIFGFTIEPYDQPTQSSEPVQENNSAGEEVSE